MTEDTGQPEPARPAPGGPAWLGYASQMTEAEFERDLLTVKDKAVTSTPGLQRALTVLAVVAALASVTAFGVYLSSHFRYMDAHHNFDAEGNRIGDEVDVTQGGVVVIAVAGAILVLVGTLSNVGARTRAALMVAGSAVLVAVGCGVGQLLDPSRTDLRQHYRVGDWGSEASFARFIHTLNAFGWLIAAFGLALLVLTFVQRRRISAAYPG